MQAESVQDGAAFQRFLNTVAERRKLPRAEAIELIAKMQAGDRRAESKIVRHNLGLVMKVALKYLAKAQESGLDIGDLFAEGVIGLTKALMRFDTGRKTAVSTYVMHWIKHAISRAIENAGVGLRLPVHVHERLGAIRKIEAQYLKEHGVLPDDAFVAEKIGIPVASLITLMQNTTPVFSLQSLIGQEDDACELMDLHVDESVNAMLEIDERVDEFRGLGYIVWAMKKLKEREAFVLKSRHIDELTLDEIGALLAEKEGREKPFSRERIRQIEEKAIERVRSLLRA